MLEGFIVIDKSKGITSADVVYRVKRMLPKGTKIGHAGTLDPNVTGVLPLAVGRATKAFAFLDDTLKTYRVSMRFGLSTDTQDVWGTVLKTETPQALSHQQVTEALMAFVGPYLQTPPMYSARKVNGQKLYDLARNGQTVEREPVLRQIYKIDEISYQHPELTFTVDCSRGTYIRTLCVDLAENLGTIAAMSDLRRVKTGVFSLDHCVTLESLMELNASLDQEDQDKRQVLISALRPISMMFKDFEPIEVDEVHSRHICHGVKVNLRRFYKKKQQPPPGTRFAVYFGDHLLGIAEACDSKIEVRQLFWRSEDFDQPSK